MDSIASASARDEAGPRSGRRPPSHPGAHKAIAQDSYLETAQRELIRSYARQGERAQALRQYQNLVELLRAELHSPPAKETSALYERVQRGDDI